MFLHTLMKNPEFMKALMKYFPKDIQEKYDISNFIHNGHIYIYIKIKKCMYSLK